MNTSLANVLDMLMFLYLNKHLQEIKKKKTNQEISSFNFQLALMHLMHLQINFWICTYIP